MNKKLLLLICLLVFLVLNPAPSLEGAVNGLNLWFDVVIPTLLPFMIISYIIQNVYSDSITKKGFYITIIGLLCGYPMGAIVITSLYKAGAISKKQAYIYLVSCNISSPAFFFSFISYTSLNIKGFPLMLALINYIPVIILIIFNVLCTKNTKNNTLHNNTSFSAAVLDDAIISSVTTLLKIGGYITIFAILAKYISIIPFKNKIINGILISICEITTGINYVAKMSLERELKVLIILLCNAFGSLSCMFQTGIFFKGTNLQIKKYMYGKILLALMTFVLWYFAIHVLHYSI